MLKLKILVCAVAAVTFLGLPVVAQDDAEGSAQVVDDELPPGDSASEGDDAAAETTPKCVPRPPKDETAEAAGEGDADKADDDLLSDDDEKKDDEKDDDAVEGDAEGDAGSEEGEPAEEGPEMSDVLDENGNPLPWCEEEKPYIPVEPPPVISDEVDFSAFGDNENSAAVRAAKADYMAVAQALEGASLEGPYKRYLVEMHRSGRKLSFSEYMYDDYYRARTGGILFIGIGVPVFGGLTALGAVFLGKGLGDDCLPANDPDEECEPPQRNDAEEKRDQGIFLLAVGTAGTVASVVIGAIKIKRANGPLNALKPLITGKNASAGNKLRFNGFSPVVATSQSAGPGSTLSFTF